MILLPTFQSCLLLCPNQQQQSVFLYAYYFLNTLSRGDKTTFVLFDIFKTISLYIRWADICFVFFFFCRALLLFSFVFRGRQTRVSWPPIGWWGPCVLRCWENPNTHRQAGLSLFYLFFFSLLSLIFFLLLLISLYNKYTLLPYPFPSSSLSIFYVCVCWLAGCLVYPTAAQRQANEKRRTVMDARP